MTETRLVLVDPAVLYPGDVEEAMPEGEMAWWLACYLVQTLRRRLGDGHSVYGNMPIYYQEGRPRKLVAPDVFLVRDLPYDRDRKSYRLWEGAVPSVVFEIVSRGHETKDVKINRRIYQRLGIEEYYWFDPATRELRALHLHPTTGRYRRVRPTADGRHASPELGLEVGIEDDVLGLYDGGVYVPPSELLLAELEQRAVEAQQLAAEAQQRAAEAEQRAAEERRLREALERRLRELEG